MATHRIRVLGRELRVKSAAPAEEVAEVEALVNRTVAEMTAKVSSGDSQLVAILAIMNIAEAYLRLQRTAAQAGQLAEERLADLLQRVDHALE
jgi:cell division protein ZapA